MIVAYVAAQTHKEAGHEFERIIREIQAEVREMTGCVKNEWFRDPAIPQRYVWYGEFDTHENFEHYQRSQVVQRIRNELMPLLEAPPEFRHYQAEILDQN
jgi:quinol monooxygenase YgiN